LIPIPSCTVATSPVDGRLRGHLAVDTDVEAGDVVATVETGGRSVDVRAPRRGRIAGFLADLTQPVAAGDGVVWLARA
jgi:predicted deacylase